MNKKGHSRLLLFRYYLRRLETFTRTISIVWNYFMKHRMLVCDKVNKIGHSSCMNPILN